MGLRVYVSGAYTGTVVSEDGLFTNPIVFKVPPTGGTYEVPLWLRHEELNGERSQSSYDVELSAADDFGTDQSSWVEFALDDNGAPDTYGPTLTIGDILVGQIYAIWVKVTVPNTPETGAREDIYIKIETSASPQTYRVNRLGGTFSNTFFDHEREAIAFDVTNDDGEWLSDWIDLSVVTNPTYLDYTTTGSHIYLSCRTSTDGSAATASAWVSSLEECNLSDPYLQIRVQFFANALAGTTGLMQAVYGNTNFSVYKASYTGTYPFSTTPGDSYPFNKSVRWSGHFYAPTSGTWVFRTVSNDGHRLYLDEDLVSDQWVTTSGSTTVSSTSNYPLMQGWHAFRTEYFHTDGDDDIKMYVTPPAGVERAIVAGDFSPTDPFLYLNSLNLQYLGDKSMRVDMRLYDGPDVPILIAPEDGFETQLFSPPLTISQTNSEYVDFQMDIDTTFATDVLVEWQDAVTPGTQHTTNAPIGGARPPGIWYWRARGVLDGVASEWSDFRFLEILPMSPEDAFLYLDVNIGFATHDSMLDERTLYLNVNIGIPEHDPIVDDRFMYLHANVDNALGKVIYPFYDDTRSRKSQFDTDEEFLERT